MIKTFLGSRIGIAAVTGALLILFYEGLPAGPLRHLPFFGPVIEELTDGRVDRVRKAGIAAERAAWQEAVAKLRREMDEERRRAQDMIDGIERGYLEERERDALLIADLEAAIANMESEDAEADHDTGPVCRPAIPRGLSRQLDAIGR